MGDRFLLCRPQGGLNDMLSQVEACCRYAEQAGRIVIVDTAYAGSSTFHDDFRNYFRSSQARLLLDPSEAGCSFDEMTVMPEFLQGRVSGYTADWRPRRAPHPSPGGQASSGWMDTKTGLPLSFKFNEGHPQELLVHHAEGRRDIALFALMRMTVPPRISDELKRRLDAIGPGYDAIHVRHTDYRSKYEEAIDGLRKAPPRRLFLATDNAEVLQQFRDVLGVDRVFSFSWLPPNAGEPLHKTVLGVEDRFNRNRDAIVDLLMLALSRRLILVRLQDGPGLSGFSQLANTLWSTKIALKHLLARDDIEVGLG